MNWLIARAQRTPYFHLDGYMNRWWLVPYNVIITRKVYDAISPNETITVTDGTGPVAFKVHPIIWCFQKVGIAIRVHQILRSDLGRDPHDHPWPYLTIILRGGYFEHRFDEDGVLQSTKWHGAGSILLRPAKSWHKLVVPDGQTCWTLFMTGKKVQTWGFNTPAGKIPYFEYKDTL